MKATEIMGWTDVSQFFMRVKLILVAELAVCTNGDFGFATALR